MEDVRPPPPVWAIVVLSFAVAFAAGVVLYFQLGTVGLDALAVATAAVLSSLLVALYYRQSAVAAEQTELQRRQLELVERLTDRVGTNEDERPPASERSVDDPTVGPASISRTGTDTDPRQNQFRTEPEPNPTRSPGREPRAARPALEFGAYEFRGDELRVDLANAGDAPATDLRLVVDVAVPAEGLWGGTATTPLDRGDTGRDPTDAQPSRDRPSEAGESRGDATRPTDRPDDPRPSADGPAAARERREGGDEGGPDSQPAPSDRVGRPTWDGGTAALGPGERDRFAAVAAAAITDRDGEEHTSPFDEAVGLLRDADVREAGVRVGLQHARPDGGTTRQYLTGGAFDPGADDRLSLADVCHRF